MPNGSTNTNSSTVSKVRVWQLIIHVFNLNLLFSGLIVFIIDNIIFQVQFKILLVFLKMWGYYNYKYNNYWFTDKWLQLPLDLFFTLKN